MNRPTRTLLNAGIGALLLAGACFASSALAQPEPGMRPQAPMDGAAAQRDMDPAQRLRHRLTMLEAERERIEAVLHRLDAGESWEDVREDLQGADAVFEGGRPGGPSGPDEMIEGPDDFGGPGGPGRKQGPRGEDEIGNGPRQPGRFQGMPDEATLHQQLREADPEGADRFEQLRQTNPIVARRLLMASAPRLQELAHLKQDNPALYEVEAEDFRIERRIMQTARSLHLAVAGDGPADQDVTIDETRAALRELVARQVDLQLDSQRIKLESAQERLQKLGESIDQRAATRESIIDERVERIMERAVRAGADQRNRPGLDRMRERRNRRDNP